MAEKCHINISKFKHANLLTCEWCTYKHKLTTIYYTDNVNPAAYCRELWWSFVLRWLRLKKYITFGKPTNIAVIEPCPPPIKQTGFGIIKDEPISNFRIRFAGEKIKAIVTSEVKKDCDGNIYYDIKPTE